MALDVLLGRMMKKTIIWDFNGTLLNDAEVCVECMNSLLKERALPHLEVSRYREIFTFPVREYYLSLGFDFGREPFEVPAHRFIDLYREKLHEAPLHIGTEHILEHFKSSGFSQIILSAMEEEFLTETLKGKGIFHYFDKVAGISNHLGEGKLDVARNLLANSGNSGHKLWLIGDTLHDFEVAEGLGIPCILIAQGHQSKARLAGLPCLIVESFEDLVALPEFNPV
jgi:phosphoglycolate phosphatase